MHVLPPIAALLFHLREILFVTFLALGSAWFAMEIFRRLRGGNNPPPAAFAPPVSLPQLHQPAPAPVLASAAPAPVRDEPPARPVGIPSHHLAVISAAIHHLYRGHAHLVGVALTSSAESRWAHEGRRDIFTSHRIR